MQPGLGMFLARDPWSGDVVKPGSMNGWSYGEGNPIRFEDPSGESVLCAVQALRLIADAVANEIIATTPTAGEKLFQLFEDDFSECDAWLCAGVTAADRLDFVLDYTQGVVTGVPSPGFPAQFRVDFGGDEGFAEEFRDSKHYSRWGGSTNQPGHFLTAVALAYRGPGVLGNLLFWPHQDSEPFLSSDDRIGLGLIVGHEKLSDQAANLYYTAQLQFYSASIQDIRVFLSALAADIRGDKQARDDYFRQILGADYDEESRVGNSIEDLRLSAKGWSFGKWVAAYKGVSHVIAGAWLRNNLAQ